MRQLMLFLMFFVMLLCVSAVIGQEEAAFEDDPDLRMEMEERELDMRRAHMEMEQQEAEANFHRQMREIELEKQRMALEYKKKAKKHHDDKGGAVLLLILLTVNILMAIWVYQDIRKRNAGSGIWIIVALLTGLFGTLVYAIVRLGDTK